jgi:tetratricopeptide (TPR) repeat protein
MAGCCLVAALAPSAGAAQEHARLTGSVVDEAGAPRGGVQVVLVPTDAAGTRQAARTNHKGSFVFGAVKPGSYTLQLVPPELRLISVEYSARSPSGEEVARFKEANVREAGNPAFEIPPMSRSELRLVVGEVALPQGPAAGISAAADPTGALERLNALFELARWEELKAESEGLLADHPELGGAVYLRGVALWKTGQLGQAADVLRRAAAMAPEQPGVRGVLGSVLLEEARSRSGAGEAEQASSLYAEAAEALSAQLAETPRSAVHLNNLVIALEGAGRPTEAMGALGRLIEVAPERTEPHLRLAELLTDAGRPEEALEALGRAPDQGPKVAAAIHNAAVVLWNQKKNDATLAAIDRALRISPGEPLFHRLRGRALIALGRLDEGVGELKEFLRLAPDSEEAEAERALVEALEKAKR